MSCNAWNHPPHCDCGWGGDTGSVRAYATVASSVNLSWSRSGSIRYASYVNPNAACPVCNARVFFYQSPHGGRVYFDELGPPWPKHPCTNNTYARFYDPKPAVCAGPPAGAPKWVRDGWEPIGNLQLQQTAHYTIITGLMLHTGKEARFCLEDTPMLDYRTPMLVRANKELPGLYQVCWLIYDEASRDIVEKRAVIYGYYPSEKIVEYWKLALEGDLEAQHALGMCISFHCMAAIQSKSIANFPLIEWDVAHHWFEQAAARGHWAASVNLGIMYLNGYGVAKDTDIAFDYLMKALSTLSLGNKKCLKNCCGEDVDCDVNIEVEDFLRGLIKVLELASNDRK